MKRAIGGVHVWCDPRAGLGLIAIGMGAVTHDVAKAIDTAVIHIAESAGDIAVIRVAPEGGNPTLDSDTRKVFNSKDETTGGKASTPKDANGSFCFALF